MKSPFTVIKNGRIFTSRMFVNKGLVIIEGNKVVDVLDRYELRHVPHHADIIDAKGNMVVPGFIDIHCHGGGGGDTSDGVLESVRKIPKAHAKFGTTALLLSVYPDTFKNMALKIEVIKKLIEEKHDGADVLGIHLEGPYLNPKERGALRDKYFRKPSIDELRRLIDISGNNIKLITVAPELEGAIELIKFCQHRDIKVAVGHSYASYQEMIRGINAGINHVTHVYNALRRIHHRDPGVMGTVLINNEVTIEVIADFHHLHPAVVTHLLMAKRPDKIVLITDALRLAGLRGKKFKADGREVKIVDGTARLRDGTIAGSILTMNKAVSNIVETGRVTVEDALKMASLNPANVIGFDDKKGSLLPERDADIVILNNFFGVLLTMVKGEIIYKKAGF